MSPTPPVYPRNPRDTEELAMREEQRSTTAIVGDLWEHMQELMKQELALLRADLEQRTQRAKQDLVELSMAGAVAHAGALALMAALILLLNLRLEAWLAALIVGLTAVAAGYAMLRHSMKKLSERDVVPRKTIESLETTSHTIKEALR